MIGAEPFSGYISRLLGSPWGIPKDITTTTSSLWWYSLRLGKASLQHVFFILRRMGWADNTKKGPW